MLKKMRRRFILSAMTAFGLVMLALVVGINLSNYYVMCARQDERLAGLMEYEQLLASLTEETPPMMSEMAWADGPEADFTMRFFIVYCDKAQQITDISQEHIASVDADTIAQYTKKILSGKRQKGYCEGYRYMVRSDEAGYTIVFLHVADEQRFVKSLLWVSLMIALSSLIIVFLLTLLLSGTAILPYVKNMERQKRFITDAGHELKTPLTSIATSADILAMEYEGDEWVKNIQKQTVRLTQLVSNLVALSRLDEAVPFPERAEFSLSDAAWEIAEPLSSLAKAGGKKYSQRIEEQLTLVGDRSSIQQMLSILFDNAIRYSDEGGQIRLDIYRRHGRIAMEVYNTCEWIDTKDMERLFDRFYRPDESRSTNTGGTGIGLSLAQAIAQAHGGSITASSKSGRDVLFRVLI